MKNPFDRWLEKVNVKENDCWEWTATKYRGGYGHFYMKINGKKTMYKAHRFSYEYFNKVDLKDGECVCHTCDNPSCVNPDHLFVGSAKDNNDDKIKKGRLGFGRKSGYSWLSLDIANKIRLIYSEGKYTMKQLGAMFNTSAAQVERIVNNKIWKNKEI